MNSGVLKKSHGLSSAQAIGLFDSGLGGLTVLRELKRGLPRESYIYLGDTARTPYGSKGSATIKRYARECATFLRQFEVKLLVVACNTVSAVALDALTEELDIPVVGTVEPAVRRALRDTRSGKIGVIGTKATIGSDAYQRRLRAASADAEIFSQACPLFVPLVEEGLFEGPLVDQTIDHYLSGLRRDGVDTIVLGCTHYPLLLGALRAYFGDKVSIVECSKAVAEEVTHILGSRDLAAAESAAATLRYFVTDEVSRFNSLASQLLGPIEAEKVEIFDLE